MIKVEGAFDDIREKDISAKASYKDIKPETNNAIKDTEEYWDDVFRPSKEDSEQFECQLSEIFGCDENDFSFDFDIDSRMKELLDKCFFKNWNELSEEQRESSVAEFADRMASKLKLDTIPTLELFEGPEDNCGAYNQAQCKIEINRNQWSNPKELVNTIAHEMRHAFQYEHSQYPKNKQDYLYALNFDNYISPLPLGNNKFLYFTDYEDQYVECEARAFASIFSKSEEI